MTLIDTLFAIIWSPFVRFRELLLTPICQKQQKSEPTVVHFSQINLQCRKIGATF